MAGLYLAAKKETKFYTVFVQSINCTATPSRVVWLICVFLFLPKKESIKFQFHNRNNFHFFSSKFPVK